MSTTLDLDRWSSFFGGGDEPVTLTPDERGELCLLLLTACNRICDGAAVPVRLRRWIDEQIDDNIANNQNPVGAYREGKDYAWRKTIEQLNELVPK